MEQEQKVEILQRRIFEHTEKQNVLLQAQRAVVAAGDYFTVDEKVELLRSLIQMEREARSMLDFLENQLAEIKKGESKDGNR